MAKKPEIVVVAKTGSNNEYRKHLRTLVRQGKAEARILGSQAEGFCIAVQIGNSVRIVSDIFDKQFKAALWAARKMNCKPRKMLTRKAA
jgi:hypothetical protein